MDTPGSVRHALGVVMFQLLANKLPFDIAGRALPEAVRMIKDDAPLRVSAVVRDCRGDPGDNRLQGHREAQEPALPVGGRARGGHPALLVGRRHLGQAGSALYVISKQLRRYKWAAATAAVFVLLLMGFAIYASYQATEKGRLALQERRAKEEVIAEQEKLQRTLYSARIGFAQAALSNSDADRLRRELEACPVRFRGWEWDYLSRLSGHQRRRVSRHDRRAAPR